MKTSKKLLSFFLAVVMVVTTCSIGFTAFAQDNSNSIWTTSGEAEDAFNSLNGLADEFLPPLLMGLLGDSANDDATMQDVLAALQPTVLNALAGTSQSDYAQLVSGGARDAAYYDYLHRYTTDEDGNKVIDDSPISFYSLYALAREYRANENLSDKTRATLREWYDQLSQIANLDVVDETVDTIKKYAKDYNDAGGLGLNAETYDSATLYELETFFDDTYMSKVDPADMAIIKAAYDKYNEELAAYSFGVKIDSFPELIYYCFGIGQPFKYAYSYYNFIKSAGADVTFTGTINFLDIDFSLDISEDITPENFSDLLIVAMLPTLLELMEFELEIDPNDPQVPDLETGEMVPLTPELAYSYFNLAIFEGEIPDELVKPMIETTLLEPYIYTILGSHYKELLTGMAMKYSNEVSSAADVKALVNAVMPAGYENGNVLSEADIKEIASLIFDFGSNAKTGAADLTSYFKNGVLNTTRKLDSGVFDINATLPASIRGTAVAEYFALIYADGSGGDDTYKNTLSYAFYSEMRNLNRNHYIDNDGNPINDAQVNSDFASAKKYDSNLVYLNYDGATFDADVVNGYVADAEKYAYTKVVAELLGIDQLGKDPSNNVINSLLDYEKYLDSQAAPAAAQVVLTPEQEKILYADYDLTTEVGTELLNYILNDTIVSVLENELLAGIINDVLGDVDLVAAVKDVWQRLYNAPIATVFELIPLVGVILDDLLLPIIFHAENDNFGGDSLDTIASLIFGLLGQKYEAFTLEGGSSIGIDQLGWDLNVILPQVLDWLFVGSATEGVTYYDGSTHQLMKSVNVDDVYELAEAVFTEDNFDEIDFSNYTVKDRNGNALKAIVVDGDISSYIYAGKTYADADALFAANPDAEFVCYITYQSNVPHLTGIYVADKLLRDISIDDLANLISGAVGGDIGVALGELVTEIVTLLREAVKEFVNSDRVNQTRYVEKTKKDDEGNDVTVKVSVFSGLNNVLVAIPQLLDIIEDLAADKYGVDKEAWVYCYEGKIYTDEKGNIGNKVIDDFKAFAGSSDPNRSVDILDWFISLFIGDWVNALLSLVNNVVAPGNEISDNLPIVTGLLNALGGFGETSILTDIFNGVFQIDRASEYSFTFEKQENGFTGLSTSSAYFLISNVSTLIPVVTNLISHFGGSGDDNTGDTPDDTGNSNAPASPVYKPKATKAAAASSSTYTDAQLSNVTDLINNLDKMISSLLADSSLNGFSITKTDNVFAGLVTFFSNYLGNDCFTDLGKLLNSYVFYITGSETHTPDSKGNVDEKKVYTNESLTGLVVETFLLIEKIVENLLGDFYDTYKLANGNSAQYNLIVEAIEGLISPDAIGIRLDGYDKVQAKLADYNCWHNAAAQTSRGDYKIKLDWGIKAGDKEAFYDGLAASLRIITSILGVILVDTNWYETVVSPILGALCDKNGIKLDTADQYAVETNGYRDEVLLGILRPLSEWFTLFLNQPATTLIKSIQGVAGILDDKNGATIASILKGAITPIVNELKGAGKIFAVKSDKLLPSSLTLQKIINNLADNTIGAYANPNNIKLGQGDYKYALSGTNLIPIINSYLASTGITLKQIDWNKLSTAKTPAAALVYILEYVLEVLLENDNLVAIAKLIGGDTVTAIIDAIRKGKINAKDILAALNKILEATDTPTLAYWSFSQYLQEAAYGFAYPAGITKQMADNSVAALDDIISGIFPLLSSFGVDLGGNNLQEIIDKNLFTNSIITSLATALYGALDGLDPMIKDILKSLGIVTSTADVAKILTDKSYGKTFTSAANTIKAQSSWKNVKNVNWGFKDGSAAAQQGFVNALAAVLRPLYNVLEIFLKEGTLKINDVAYNLICSLDIPYTVKVIDISDSKDAPIQLKLSYRMKDGVLTLKFREYEGNRERSRSSELKLDFTSLKDLKDLKIEGTNGYNSAIIPLLEALQCSDVKTYAQYKKDVASAKDNLLLDILNPLVGDSNKSFLNKLTASPVAALTELLPNVAAYLDAHGLSQLISNLLAPVTEIVYTLADNLNLNVVIKEILGESLGDYLGELLGLKKGTLKIDLTDLTKLNIEDLIIPIVNKVLAGLDNPTLSKLKLKNIDWNKLISLGTKMNYTSKATGADGNYLTGKKIGNVDNGKVLITVLRYIAGILVDNAPVLKSLIGSLVGNNDMIKSIINSVFNTLSTASPDQIVAALMYLLDGRPKNAFWDYTSYKTGTYDFAFPDNMDVDFVKSLPAMLDGMISGLLDLNETIGKALFKDSIITSLVTGLYGAVEGVKINDDLNLTQLLAQTGIDFSTSTFAKLLVDEKYGQKFESAASVISSAGSWAKVNKDALKWGVTDRDSFFHALVAALRPLYGVLDVLINDAYLGLFDMVRIPGSNGYSSSIVPLMEAFSMYNIKTQYQYRQDMTKEYDAILLDIINPLWDKVEDILAAPLQTLAAVIPNLALFIGNDGLCQIINNLLTPISALLDSIRPIVDLNSLLTTILDALNVDLNKILGKVGIKNLKIDLYDLNKTLKPILGGDALIPLINNILGIIKIGGSPLGLKLNAVDWLQLASHGTTIVSASQAATYGPRIYVEGDSAETLVAVLRYLISTINTGDNFDKISSLIGGLIGGADDSVADIVGSVLEVLQGETDDVLFQLVELLKTLGG